MAKLLRLQWNARIAGIDLPREDRRSCIYEAYVPDELQGRAFVLKGTVAADVSDAEHAIVALNARATALLDTEAIARLLLRAESAASCRIEGLEIGPRRLLRADAVRQLGDGAEDVGAAEVLANIDAMAFAADTIRDGLPISLETVLEVHRRLLAPSTLREHAGNVRTEQNWIGGNRYNPCSAAFVPPPPNHLPRLLRDLIDFCNDDSLPPVIQAAVAHAQFETIHPFLDGNGRVGRLLITFMLTEKQMLHEPVLYLSLFFKKHRHLYYDRLNGTRKDDGWKEWLDFFLQGVRDTANQAVHTAIEIDRLFRADKEKIDQLGRGAPSALLVYQLAQASPIFSIKHASRESKLSFPTASAAVQRLTDAGILQESSGRRRDRLFLYAKYLDVLNRDL